MGEVIHRGAAGLHFHMARGVGGEFCFLMGGGVIEIHSDRSFLILVCIRHGTKKASRAGLAREAVRTAVPLSFITQIPVTWAVRRASASPALPDALPIPLRRRAYSRRRALSVRWMYGTLSVQHAIQHSYYSRRSRRCQPRRREIPGAERAVYPAAGLSENITD